MNTPNTLIADKYTGLSLNALHELHESYVNELREVQERIQNTARRIRAGENGTAALRNKLSKAIKLKVNLMAEVDAIENAFEDRSL